MLDEAGITLAVIASSLSLLSFLTDKVMAEL